MNKNRFFRIMAILFVIAGISACSTSNSVPVPSEVQQLPTEMPILHTKLPITLEQTDTDPVVIGSGGWQYDSTFSDSGSLEYAYQRECKLKFGEEGQCIYIMEYNWALLVVHNNNTLIVFANKMAFDHRDVIIGLPPFYAEDRWIWDSSSKINMFVNERELQRNANVVYVNAQTYAVQNGAEWEIVAFGGGGIEPQRWIRTNDGEFTQSTP